MKKKWRVALWAAVGIALPNLAHADTGWADNIKSLNGVLDQLYSDMIPMCDKLIGVARGIAGFGALWYIAVRVWRHLASAEPIDFYPLFRPFALGICIVLFPGVIGVINGVLKPTVTGTAMMVQNSDEAIATLLQQKEEAVKQTDNWLMFVGTTGAGDRDKWYQYTHPTAKPGDEGVFESIGNDVKFAFQKMSYNFRNAIKQVMSEVLQILFAAVSLTINTMRTFNLILLAIIGPLVFGISVFDGFGSSLRHWLARYINVFLWLPVANIFGAVIGKIQENMLKIDISQIHQAGDTFFSKADAGYLIFMIIGIFGYLTVPNVAGQIVWVSGGDALNSKMTGMAMGAVGAAGAATGGAVKMAGGAVGAGLQQAGRGAWNLAGAPMDIAEGYDNHQSTGKGDAAALGRHAGRASSYLASKLKGNKDEG